MPKLLELGDQAIDGPFFVFALGVGVNDRRVVQLAVLEHVVERDQDRVLDSAERDPVAGAGLDAPVLAGEVAVLDADRPQPRVGRTSRGRLL